MSMKSICKTEVVTIPKNSTLKEVARLMQRKHVGSVVVTETHEAQKIPAGIITDRDLALTMGSSDKPQDLPVENVMQSHPVSVNKSDGIYKTITVMLDNAVKRLPVVNDDGSLYGIVCSDDLLGLIGEETYNLSRLTETQIQKEHGVRMPTETHLQM